MQGRIPLIIPPIDTNPGPNQQLAIIPLIALHSNMQSCHIKISNHINIDLRMIYQPGYELGGGMHRGVVDRTP
jgi:hypothetical protein